MYERFVKKIFKITNYSFNQCSHLGLHKLGVVNLSCIARNAMLILGIMYYIIPSIMCLSSLSKDVMDTRCLLSMFVRVNVLSAGEWWEGRQAFRFHSIGSHCLWVSRTTPVTTWGNVCYIFRSWFCWFSSSFFQQPDSSLGRMVTRPPAWALHRQVQRKQRHVRSSFGFVL